MTTKTKNPSEHAEQVLLINWFRLNYPQYIIFSIANGGKRDLIEAKRLKDEGLLKGMPDIGIIIYGTTIYLEMKTRNGKLSPAQLSLIPKIQNLGNTVLIGYGFFDAKNKIEEVLNEQSK